MPAPSEKRYGMQLRAVGDVLTPPAMDWNGRVPACRCMVRVHTGSAERPDEDLELVAGGANAHELHRFRMGQRIYFGGYAKTLTRSNGSLGWVVGIQWTEREEDQQAKAAPVPAPVGESR